MTNNTMYTVQELHIFHDHSRDHYKLFHFHYSFNFHNLNILNLTWFITLTIGRHPNKFFIKYSFVNQVFIFTLACPKLGNKPKHPKTS